MSSLDCGLPTPLVQTHVPTQIGSVVCDPLKPVKSSVQGALDDTLNRPSGALNTFTLISKNGDLVVPANVHIRFYNCTFDSFDATQGNNIFYFEQCTFTQKPVMADVVAIASGTTFRRGADVTRTTIELVPHDSPNIDSVPCSVNDTFSCDDHSYLKSSSTVFEWLDGQYNDIDESLFGEMGFLSEIATFCGVVTGGVRGIVAWANKSILRLLNFSTFESMLDKFLNIGFTLINMIDGCVAKLSGMIFGAIDTLLAPFFSCVTSFVKMFSDINSLISLAKSIPDRIINMANGCYARIMDTAQLMANKVAFLLDTKSRLELQLNQRIIAVNGAIADLSNSSKLVLRNCGVMVSPTSFNTIPMVKVDSTSHVDISKIKFIATANASILKLLNGAKAKLKSVTKIESVAVEGSGQPLVDAADSDLEISAKEAAGNCTIVKATNCRLNLSFAKAEIASATSYVYDLTNCVV